MHLEAERLQEHPGADRDVQPAYAALQEVEVAVLDPEAGADRVRLRELQDDFGAA